MMPAIEVIIVNFNTGEAVSHCVRSLISQGEPVIVTVIDNASTDGSHERLRSLYGDLENVSVIDNQGNPGFAQAVNTMVRKLDPAAGGNVDTEYLMILNPDCELLSGSLSALRAALDAAPGAALAGPLVVDAEGVPMKGNLRRFPNPWRSFVTFSGLWRLRKKFPLFEGVERSGAIPDTTTEAEAVTGACMLLRKKHFLEAGCMDEAYGLHCEDLDLMYRLHQRGHLNLFVPDARVYHKQGVSSRSRPVWVHWQKHRGMQRFFLKFQASQYLLPIRWLVVAGIWIRFILTLPLLMFRK
jgi:GT2 family glycosyltransferase